MIKLLIGGSPCTFWSIAQTKQRETEPYGLGWELFKNYLIAKKKFKPDFFLYENNKSAAEPIKARIKLEFGVTDENQMDLFTLDTGARYIEINSALVSAQNRQRFYCHNCGNVNQPKDRGILLKDILESGISDKEKARAVITSVGRTTEREYFTKRQGTMVAEKVPAMKVKEATAKGFAEIEAGGCVDMAQPNSKTRRGRSMKDKCNCLTTSNQFYQYLGTKDKPIYKVEKQQILIKGKKYPLKIIDGYYILRKLTVTECARLQTMLDDYCKAVSNSQAYKGLGNGWTAEVIIHILNGALKDVSRDEEIVVLSMYDGIGTGRYCLDKMGFKNVKYYAYEIDKYAMTISHDNFPDIVQLGDAFDVRANDWEEKYKELFRL